MSVDKCNNCGKPFTDPTNEHGFCSDCGLELISFASTQAALKELETFFKPLLHKEKAQLAYFALIRVQDRIKQLEAQRNTFKVTL